MEFKDSSEEVKKGFFDYVFNFDNTNSAQLGNMYQYTFIAIPLVLLSLKSLNYFSPEIDDNKGTLEILFEIFVSINWIILSIWFVNKIIRYIPTKSKMSYPIFNEVNFLIPLLIVLFTMNTKLGNKINILIERMVDVYDGKTNLKDNKNNSKEILLKTLCPGIYEINKGVHIQNRKLKLNFLTNKDYKAIEIGKKYNIKYFALSFTNSKNDIKKFNQLLPKEKKIYKIETKKALDHFDTIIKHGQEFLIDRGDLSKEISIEMIPVAQRKILKFSQKFRDKKIYVATNFLESMIENNFPNRAEVNDIFSTLSQGSAGLVLAAETAIGKNPKNCVNYLTKIIRVFKKYNNR